MIAWSDVVALYSSLSAVPADAQTLILEFVEAEVSEARWGEGPAKRARIALAGHLGTLERRAAGGVTSAGGQLTSETVGQVSRSYAAPQLTAAATQLGSTAAGVEYERLIMQRGQFRFLVG